MPFDNVLGEEGRASRVLMSGLDYERVVLAGIGSGIMAACLDEVMPYMARAQAVRPADREFQLMQGKIADMYTAMNSARAYVYEVAAACDRGEVTRQDAAACVLYYASREAMKVRTRRCRRWAAPGSCPISPVAAASATPS